MSKQLPEDARLIASVDEGSETDVEPGNANDHNESASFLGAFKEDQVAYGGEPQMAEKRIRNGRAGIMSVSCTLQVIPWALSIILFVAFMSERLQRAMVRINRQEAEKLPHLSQHVAIEEYKDEYVVGMTFTHTMHCLNSLRKKLYPGRYHDTSWIDAHGNITYHKWWHTDHCIEMLRRYITCHADTTAFTYDWVENTSILVHPGTIHTCKNFDRVVDWLQERRVNAPLRKHVEDGKIVDYDNQPTAPAWAEVEPTAPKNWTFKKEDLYDTGEAAPNAV